MDFSGQVLTWIICLTYERNVEVVVLHQWWKHLGLGNLRLQVFWSPPSPFAICLLGGWQASFALMEHALNIEIWRSSETKCQFDLQNSKVDRVLAWPPRLSIFFSILVNHPVLSCTINWKIPCLPGLLCKDIWTEIPGLRHKTTNTKDIRKTAKALLTDW